MTETLASPQAVEGTTAAEQSRAVAQSGATSFSDLVRAHYRREEERKWHGVASDEAQADYDAKLGAFEQQEGGIAAVYWSTCNASAIAMTVGRARGERNPVAETETEVRLHRVTDWVTKDASQIAELLHECDLLALRVSEILRGTSERITMRWIFAVQAHLLGFFERNEERDADAQRELVEAQRRELMKVEDYYLRTAAMSGRIVYVSGMWIGAAATAVVGTLLAFVLATWYPAQWDAAQILLLCTGAGAVGALVSVLSRMNGGSERFTVDFELGRPLLRRLGLYKPIVGSVFGVALYFLLASGLLMTDAPAGDGRYFYGIIAFFAGFSERFTGVIFGSAQKLVGGGADTEEMATPAKP